MEANDIEAAEWYSTLTKEDHMDLHRVMAEQAVGDRLDRVLYLGKRMKSGEDGERAQEEGGNFGNKKAAGTGAQVPALISERAAETGNREAQKHITTHEQATSIEDIRREGHNEEENTIVHNAQYWGQGPKGVGTVEEIAKIQFLVMVCHDAVTH